MGIRKIRLVATASILACALAAGMAPAAAAADPTDDAVAATTVDTSPIDSATPPTPEPTPTPEPWPTEPPPSEPPPSASDPVGVDTIEPVPTESPAPGSPSDPSGSDPVPEATPPPETVGDAPPPADMPPPDAPPAEQPPADAPPPETDTVVEPPPAVEPPPTVDVPPGVEPPPTVDVPPADGEVAEPPVDVFPPPLVDPPVIDVVVPPIGAMDPGFVAIPSSPAGPRNRSIGLVATSGSGARAAPAPEPAAKPSPSYAADAPDVGAMLARRPGPEPQSDLDRVATAGAGIVAGLAVTTRAQATIAVAMEFGRAGGGWAGALVFNIWLRRQLRERRMSQRQLAALSGVDHSTISRLLSQDRRPSLATATKLVEALGHVRGEEAERLAANYFQRMPEEMIFPARRVEMALRADEELDEEEIRRLMSMYLKARRRHQMAAQGSALQSPAPATPARVTAERRR